MAPTVQVIRCPISSASTPDKAMHPDTLLAYAMNGVRCRFSTVPLRAIVPGWEGAYSVKWLTDLQVSDREHDGFFVQTGYRYPVKCRSRRDGRSEDLARSRFDREIHHACQ